MTAWQSYPFGLALAFLFALAMLRGQATYWLARVATVQALQHTSPTRGWPSRLHRWLTSEPMQRGRGTVQRRGAWAVALCYLTVGLQTIVLASAGVLRMRWLTFSLSQSVGSLAWALIYSTVGFAFWAAFGEFALTGDTGVLVWSLAVVVTAAVLIRWRFSRARRHCEPIIGLANPSAQSGTVDGERTA